MNTLHKYLARDLLKATCMSAVAFTLLMTILGLFEPMRKQGLGPRQAMALFVFTLPVMMSFTLPIAAVFAAALVYGRFSQDNELTACRASGVSTINVLKPALATGAIVTVLALALGNFVAPVLAGRAGAMFLSGAKRYFFNTLKRKGTFELDRFIIRSDQPDLQNERLVGVVGVIKPDKNEADDKARQAAAALAAAEAMRSAAVTEDERNAADAKIREARMQQQQAREMRHRIEFGAAATGHLTGIKTTPEGDIYVGIYTNRAIHTDTETFSLTHLRAGGFELPPMSNPTQEKVRWYTWARLLRTVRDLTQHVEVRRELRGLRQEISLEVFSREFKAAIDAGDSYDGLESDDRSFHIRAPKAESLTPSEVRLTGSYDVVGQEKDVVVDVFRDGELEQTVTARHGRVIAKHSPVQGRTLVTIELTGFVQVRYADEPNLAPVRKHEWTQAGLPLPANIRAAQETISLADLCERPAELTGNQSIIDRVMTLRDHRMPKLVLELIAEMHERVAYGASCFMMVAMGAALGLIFRGGQVVTAFALTVVPAALVILMVFMGKELVRNPETPMLIGLAALWGGIGLISIANGLIYWRLSRQ